jgi:hypothetical protein
MGEYSSPDWWIRKAASLPETRIAHRASHIAHRVLWHNQAKMFRGLAITLVLTSVGINLPTRAG